MRTRENNINKSHVASSIQFSEDLEEACILSGIKVTDSRRIILDVLDEAEGFLAVDDIYMRVSNKHSQFKMSMSAIYCNLKKFVEFGIVVGFMARGKKRYGITKQ